MSLLRNLVTFDSGPTSVLPVEKRKNNYAEAVPIGSMYAIYYNGS